MQFLFFSQGVCQFFLSPLLGFHFQCVNEEKERIILLGCMMLDGGAFWNGLRGIK